MQHGAKSVRESKESPSKRVIPAGGWKCFENKVAEVLEKKHEFGALVGFAGHDLLEAPLPRSLPPPPL